MQNHLTRVPFFFPSFKRETEGHLEWKPRTRPSALDLILPVPPRDSHWSSKRGLHFLLWAAQGQGSVGSLINGNGPRFFSEEKRLCSPHSCAIWDHRWGGAWIGHPDWVPLKVWAKLGSWLSRGGLCQELPM